MHCCRTEINSFFIRVKIVGNDTENSKNAKK